jgi:hypothetical protein
MELRIDVQLPADNVEADLACLYERMQTRGDAMHAVRRLAHPLPGFTLWHREADGEHYVYVEDTAQRRLAGCTVFNRLVELDRRADRCLRAPHSKYARMYQRRGLASAVYRWGLDAGMCLITGARQSPGAHALWHALARERPLVYVHLKEKALRFLGDAVEAPVLEDFHTRMVLLGDGWSPDRFVHQAARGAACALTGSG